VQAKRHGEIRAWAEFFIVGVGGEGGQMEGGVVRTEGKNAAAPEKWAGRAAGYVVAAWKIALVPSN
jgi:hypothetical protein